jgi:hypothetical protein
MVMPVLDQDLGIDRRLGMCRKAALWTDCWPAAMHVVITIINKAKPAKSIDAHDGILLRLPRPLILRMCELANQQKGAEMGKRNKKNVFFIIFEKMIGN